MSFCPVYCLPVTKYLKFAVNSLKISMCCTVLNKVWEIYPQNWECRLRNSLAFISSWSWIKVLYKGGVKVCIEEETALSSVWKNFNLYMMRQCLRGWLCLKLCFGTQSSSPSNKLRPDRLIWKNKYPSQLSYLERMANNRVTKYNGYWKRARRRFLPRWSSLETAVLQ